MGAVPHHRTGGHHLAAMTSRSVRLWRSLTARPASVAAISLAAAGGMAASVVLVPDGRGILGAGLAVVAVLIAAVDARHFIIPNELTVVAVALGLCHAAASDPDMASEALLAAGLRGVVLALVFWGFRTVYRLLRHRDGLGLGDVKLAAAAGVWLDWLAIPLAIEIAAVTALATYMVRQYALGRAMRASNRLPFGLFFAPAIWLGWLIAAALPPPPW